MIKGTLIRRASASERNSTEYVWLLANIRRLVSTTGCRPAGSPDFDQFEADEAEAESLANTLARILDEARWYGPPLARRNSRVFRPDLLLPPSDNAGRADDRAHGRAKGIPEHQLGRLARVGGHRNSSTRARASPPA